MNNETLENQVFATIVDKKSDSEIKSIFDRLPELVPETFFTIKSRAR